MSISPKSARMMLDFDISMRHQISGCTLTPNAQHIVAALGFTVKTPWGQAGRSELGLWETATGRLIYLVEVDDGLTHCECSPDGQFILAGSDDSPYKLRLWETATGRYIRMFEGHQGAIGYCDFDPTGKYCLSASVDGTMRLWNVTSGALVHIFGDGDDYGFFVSKFSPNGEYIVTTTDEHYPQVWDVSTKQVIRELKPQPLFAGSTTYDCAFSPNGEYVLGGMGYGPLLLWELQTGKQVRALEGHVEPPISPLSHEERMRRNDYPISCAFAPDGRFVFSASRNGTLRMCDVSTGEKIDEWKTDSALTCCKVKSNGKNTVIVAGDKAGYIHVFHLADF